MNIRVVYFVRTCNSNTSQVTYGELVNYFIFDVEVRVEVPVYPRHATKSNYRASFLNSYVCIFMLGKLILGSKYLVKY